MIELVYASAAVHPFSEDDLRTLLTRSRTQNERAGLTGILLHDRGSFLQVLEGDAVAVNALYTKIAKDPRHERITKLLETSVRERSFDRWSMGFVSLDAHRGRDTPGFSAFLAPTFSIASFLTSREHQAARQMLLAFRAGRLRTAVDV